MFGCNRVAVEEICIDTIEGLKVRKLAELLLVGIWVGYRCIRNDKFFQNYESYTGYSI